ncbi:CBS domain-containing protein [Candidatus Bathyarchaeota archaeon]|nr:CBS domain-containing protein [Candidatus Bathyarchaeota archaeon]
MSKTLEELAQIEVSQLLTKQGSKFDPKDPSSKALGFLKDTGQYEVAVSSGRKVGIITVRNLLGVEQPQNTKIESIWDQVGEAQMEDPILVISDIMLTNNVRALPVISNDTIIGIISQTNIIEEMSKVSALREFKSRDILRTSPITMKPEEGIAQARRIMLDKGISHLPIVENGKIKGVVTAEHIVHNFITPSSKTTRGDRAGAKVSRFPGQVSAIMDYQPCILNIKSNVYDVAKELTRKGKSACLMVDDNENLIGIITPKELLSVITATKPETSLPVYIVGLTDEDFLERSIAENKVRRTVNKSLKIHPDISEVRINVKKQSVGGERTRYQLTARALGPSTSFQAKYEDWGLMESFDGVCDALDKTLRRAKKEPQKGPRRGRRRRNPQMKR